MFIKQSFIKSSNKKGIEKTNVLIYGSGKMGIITKSALERDQGNSYNIEGFIDDDYKKEGLLKIKDQLFILKRVKCSTQVENKYCHYCY